MSQVAIGKTAFGGLLLIMVGIGIVLPTFPIDAFDTFYMVIAFVGGVHHLLEGAGPRNVRVRLLEWRTSTKGKIIEWSGGTSLLICWVWDYGMDISFILITAFFLWRLVGWEQFYENLNDEKRRLQQNHRA